MPLNQRTSGYDLVCAALATRVLVRPPEHYALPKDQLPSSGTDPASVEERYEALFKMVLTSLRPGGHFMIADHVGALTLFDHLKLLEAAGFVDVDCAWRERDFFVCGGRRPPKEGNH